MEQKWEQKLLAEAEQRKSVADEAAQAVQAAEEEAKAAARAEAYAASAAENKARRDSIKEKMGATTASAGSPPAKAKNMTTAQVKRALREKGIEPPEGASREELEKLLAAEAGS